LSGRLQEVHLERGVGHRLGEAIAKLEDAGCEESVVGLVIPTGYSFNLDGTCLYLATVAVFLAQAGLHYYWCHLQ
jgi:Na+/H+-dicarboxylate symporter